ncbi:MAG TPA: GNAT family N-acetyltransferase [Nocardioides sp.]|nr:GNAT family N-acetyltransferase [Nocardioides sp.]
MTLVVSVATGPGLALWRDVHNAVVPTAPLSAEDVARRARLHRLTLAHVDGELVGNATLRPPTERSTVATVIVRILPEHRRRGHGTSYYATELEHALRLSPSRIETVVLASNHDGLEFARHRGFVEHDRYVLDGDSVAFVDLHLPPPSGR